MQAYTETLLSILHSATDEEIEAGRIWYNDAHAWACYMGTANGLPLRVNAAVLALMSPLAPWARNKVTAFEVVALWIEGGAEAVMSSRLHTGATLAKVARVLAGEDPDAVVSGPKVRAFWRNIEHAHDDPETLLAGLDFDTDGTVLEDMAESTVTLDRWAIRACRPGNHSDTVGVVDARDMRAAYVEAAYAFGGLTPWQAQAVVWVVMRGTAD